MALRRGDTTHQTIAEAKLHFGVAEKTVYHWINTGIIPRPDQLDHGARSVYVFDDEYLERADRALEQHRLQRRLRAIVVTDPKDLDPVAGDDPLAEVDTPHQREPAAPVTTSLAQQLRSLVFDGSLRREIDATVDDADLQVG